MCSEWGTLLHSVLKGKSLSKPYSWGQGSVLKRSWKDRTSQRWWMIPRKHFLLDTAGLMNRWPPRHCDSIIHDLHRFKSKHGEEDMGTWKFHTYQVMWIVMEDFLYVAPILAVSSTISKSAALPQGTGVAVCRLRRTLSWVKREMKALSTHSP